MFAETYFLMIMRRTILNYLVVGLLTAFFSCNAFTAFAESVPMGILPRPLHCDVSSTEYIPLDRVVLLGANAEAQSWAARHLKSWYGKFVPKVELVAKDVSNMGDEEYELLIDDKGVNISARTLQGVRYALYSLRQIVIARTGTKEVDGWIAPKAIVKDSPKISFRGVHICWFRETEPWEVERLIRLAAYYKMNYAVIESWGTFRSSVAPWYGWKEGTMTKKEIKRLKAIADDLGITLIPQINVFGHASQARGAAGKHATLDVNPKYQPLFEPLMGWNWCLSNPETRKLLQALIKERYEAFGCPPYFHIGCDEAHLPSCPECASKPYSQLFLEHIKAMNETISSLGARTMMWHDMLIEQGDSRWNGFVVNGTKETAAGFLQLPKDIIICDWYYGGVKPSYPTYDYFKEQGFSVLACPWNNADGIKAQSKYAYKVGTMGVLGTLWHHYFGHSLAKIYYALSNSMWNPEADVNINIDHYNLQRVHHHLRQIGWDMKLKDPRHAGTYYDEIPPEPFLNN